jgi:hypothetical protein
VKYMIAASTRLRIAKNETAFFTVRGLVNREKSIGYPSATAMKILVFLSCFQILEYDASKRDIYIELCERLGFLGKLIMDFNMKTMSAAIAVKKDLVFVASGAHKLVSIGILKTEEWN